MLKKIVFIILFLAITSSLAIAKTLHLVTLESPPAEYLEDGKPKGINIAIVEEALSRMGYDYTIEFVPWQRALRMVEKGEADGIIDAAYNMERAEYLLYPSEELYVEEWYCFNRKGSGLTLDEDFGNASSISLGVSRGFVYGGLIQQAIDNNLFKKIETVRGYRLNIKKLANNRVDMIIGVGVTVLYIARDMGYSDYIEVTKMTGTNNDYLLSASKTYLAFSKKTVEQQTVDDFSDVLAKMKQDGTKDKIYSELGF